jgi:hypothetical protein
VCATLLMYSELNSSSFFKIDMHEEVAHGRVSY